MKPDRIPRILLGAWLPYARKTGKPFKQFEMRTYVHQKLSVLRILILSLGCQKRRIETYGQRELNIFSTSLLVHTQDQMLNAYTPPSVLTLTKYLNMKSLALRERQLLLLLSILSLLSEGTYIVDIHNTNDYSIGWAKREYIQTREK